MAAERVIAGISCGEILARLADYLDGELDADTLAAVQKHVAECSECDRFGGAYAAVVGALRRAPTPASIDDEDVAAIVRRAAV